VSGLTPLMAAARGDSTPTIELLLEKGADLEATDSVGNTALHWGVMLDAAGAVRTLLSAGANVNARGCYCRPPLHMAAKTGNMGVVDALLLAGADVNACPWTNNTALNLACYHGHAEVVKRLLDAGHKFIPRQCSLSNALYVAAGEARFRIVEMLLERADEADDMGGTLRSVLCDKMARDDFRNVVFLVRHGAEVNGGRIGLESSPLWFALRGSRFDIAEFLIRSGADVNASDYNGRTLLDLVKTGAERRFLRRHGALFGHEVDR